MYHRLRQDSQFHSKYIYGALECAAAKLKTYKRTKKEKPDAKIPYITKNHLILDNQLYKIEYCTIRIPVEPTKYLFIKLTKYILDKIKDVKLGNVVITDDRIIISYSKDVPEQIPCNFIGIDRNLDNVTTFGSMDTVLFMIYLGLRESLYHIA